MWVCWKIKGKVQLIHVLGFSMIKKRQKIWQKCKWICKYVGYMKYTILITCEHIKTCDVTDDRHSYGQLPCGKRYFCISIQLEISTSKIIEYPERIICRILRNFFIRSIFIMSLKFFYCIFSLNKCNCSFNFMKN